MQLHRYVRPRRSVFCLVAGAFILMTLPTAQAQLIDRTLSPNVANEGIAKSLAQEAGVGRGDIFTPNSSAFIIARDPFRAIRRGRQLFQRKFNEPQGAGPIALNGQGDINNILAIGAGLADSCAACHGRPRGSAGFGGDVATRPDSRDAPHLFGLGLKEMLADEITAALRGLRDQAIRNATGGATCSNPTAITLPFARDGVGTFCWVTSGTINFINSWNMQSIEVNGVNLTNQWKAGANLPPRIAGNYYIRYVGNFPWSHFEATGTNGGGGGGGGGSVTVPLTYQGINYGSLTVDRNGVVDTSQVVGVDPDLRVRPFFTHGQTISMREFIIGALNDEMGMQSVDPEMTAARTGGRYVTPSGMVLDGALDHLEGAAATTPTADPDGDGVVNEIPTSIVDFFEFYLLNYFKAATYEETPATISGRQTFVTMGCVRCHVPDLTINNDRRVADLETAFDPVRGIFNGMFATAVPKFTAVDDGSGHPTLKRPARGSFVVKNIFTDFKRHNLGPNFHERNYNGTTQTDFLTTALWGVGSTPTYGHDGRSINLTEVILRHGGEAQTEATRFAALADTDRRNVLDFLNSLVLFPPDDTASTLDPGNRADPAFPQRGHGSIRLGALFNNPADPE